MVYKYYCTQRPAGLGTIPKTGLVEIGNFYEKMYCPAIKRDAWAVVWYNRKLTEQEVSDYELTAVDCDANMDEWG